MNLKKVRIELYQDEIQQIMAAALDDNKDVALAFVKKTLPKRIEKALQPH